MNQSSSMYQTKSILPNQIIETDGADLRIKFNHSSFMFSHSLAGHPLFELPRLVKLSNALLSKEGHRKPRCHTGDIPVHLKWGETQVKEQVLDALANIEVSNSWVLLYSVQADPEYKALLDQIITELSELLTLPLRQEITWLDAYIFIASPNAVTPYHIDHESTFLFQIQGEREAHLFNPRDRQILSEPEIENYYLGDLEAANYKVQNQSKANVFHLVPGQGVHHPTLAPHCYKNGNHASIALGVHFCLRSIDLKARVYQTNYYLRKLGLKPTPPGHYMWLDNIKVASIGLISKRKPANKFELLRSGVMRINRPLKLAKWILKWSKQTLDKTIKNVPVVSDFYHYWIFGRSANAYRGVYETFSDAIQAVPPGNFIGYNQSGYFSISQIGEFYSRDYPILFWLKSLFADSSSIFDFGGRIGETSYYAYRKYIRYPNNLRWVISDVPEVVRFGEMQARTIDSPGLSFTSDFSKAEDADIFLTCGTLQYVEQSLAESLEKLKVKPRHLLINRVPFYNGKTFFTLQNILFAYTPYKIQNRAEFIDSLAPLGYELIDSWHDNRTCYIPFHSDRSVSGYHGFYFRQQQAGTQTVS